MPNSVKTKSISEKKNWQTQINNLSRKDSRNLSHRFPPHTNLEGRNSLTCMCVCVCVDGKGYI